MKNYLTIKVFSKFTGIPTSALRYYEQKNLLIPMQRTKKSGYRLYSHDQIATAKFIASLRIADIPITEIQTYLTAEKEEKENMKKNWALAIKEKQAQLTISLNYLESNELETVYLIDRKQENIIWFPAEAPPGQFRETFLKRRHELKTVKQTIHNTYFRYLSGNRKWIKGEIGFAIEPNQELTFSAGHIEKMDASLCIGFPYDDHFSNIESGYRQLFQYALKYDWVPRGEVLEWYRGDQINKMDIIMPVRQMGGESYE
ncbi:hypothetical protein GCM10008986_21640 [Salinibacillus aidingensis]|uniref:HTH merR-type domain-containing protein n=1 Tax=Salinibacillus aidingensis TaxID=237684 RepID=A0ABN1BC98_9BACI